MKNASLELPYHEDSQNSTVRVADGWTYFASTGKPPEREGPCALPEFKALSRFQDARRVYDGDTAQCWFIRWKIFDAGIYQRVPAVQGAEYTFSAMGQAWCSQSDDPTVSDGDMHVSLGIDPSGGVDAFSDGVVWSDWGRVGAEYQRYNSPQVVAQSANITVFVRAWNKWELSHNDMYCDDIRLTKVGGGTPPGGGEFDWDTMRQLIKEELAERQPVIWPR